MIGRMILWRYDQNGPSQYPDTLDVAAVVDEIHLSPPASRFVIYTVDHVEFTSDQLIQINADVAQKNLESRSVYVWKNNNGYWIALPEGAQSPTLYPLPTIFELPHEPAGTYFFVICP